MNNKNAKIIDEQRENHQFNQHIAFIGAGNMATAIIAGLIAHGYPAQNITATAPSSKRTSILKENYAINISCDNYQAASKADVIVLAVKPQLMAEVCTPLQSIDYQNKLVISIAAGINSQRLSEMLIGHSNDENSLELVRVMPNTPSLLGLGMSGLYADKSVSAENRTFTELLFRSVGQVCWVEQEFEINHIIAAAGSAPAYFFLFMEAMQNEAIALGFDSETARLLVQQSALGAAKMVIANPDISLNTLREQVTSKGGTTAQALQVFNQYQLSDIVAQAMQAAVARAIEMEKQY